MARHEHMAVGMVLQRWPGTDREACVNCGLDAEGCTLTTWKWAAPGESRAMCFWCLELFEVNGWLAGA